MNWLIYGHLGWIGSYFIDHLKKAYPNINILVPFSRADNIEGIQKDLDDLKPDRVLSFIGRTSGPGFNSIDYLELPGKLVDNVRDNLFSPLILMKECEKRNIHFSYLGTGCIFSYENNDDPYFMIESKPNFFGSSYSIVKGFTDQLTILFPNVLNVRIRMPIVEYDHPKNFISKILRYPKIWNMLNSMTVLPEMIDPWIESVMKGKTGTINLVNPEPIDHNTILELYKKYVNIEHTWENVIEEDLNLKSKRSNNVLEPSFEVLSSHKSIVKIFKNGFDKKF